MLRLRVKEVAKQQGLSIKKLSQRSGISYHIVSALVYDPYFVTTTDILQRLAKALGVPVTELIEDVPDEQWQREMRRRRTEGGD
ncbi:MAG: helix-turn-helix transcriptional regulator [Thermogemmatispora sp.]|uniref:helix-turn-helix domain-containing protein n=1 Tax=Thermogemmatispora sp. TaxID=1968838 RepID=UPI002625711F|nr:helix-turn-helix transcriptional regulator [Thermogemmatispora sp.]MBX5457432.1 helix-turn-helix transcriptional regulator [Thermogemmatispora sp.]